MSQYMLLMRTDDEDKVGQLTEEDWGTLLDRFVRWADDLEAQGRLRGVQRLLDPTQGRTLRKRTGEITVDGPFAEGKEAVLGFFIIEAKDLQEALRIGEQIPFLDFGGAVEVREVGDFPR